MAADGEFERVVVEVIRRLGLPKSKNSTGRTVDGVFVAKERVITLASLADRLEGIKRIVAPAKGLVTPAARDLLKSKGIELEFAVSPTPSESAGAKAKSLTLGISATSYSLAPLLASLARDGIQVERLPEGDMTRLPNQFEIAAERSGAPAAWLTDEPAVAACLANRRPRTRALVVSDAVQGLASARGIGANLLVVEPRRHATHLLRRLLGDFARSGPYSVPDRWRAALGAGAATA